MGKQTHPPSVGQIWHPSDEELLLFCDGELSHRLAQRVKEHLNECWPCRTRQADFAKSIYQITKFRNRVLDTRARQHSPDDPLVLRRFETRLQIAATEMNRAPQLSRWFRLVRNQFLAPRRLLPRVVPPALAAVLFALVLFRLDSTSPVSAAEVLQRSAQAQSLVVSRTQEPVVYQKLQIRRSRTGSPSRAMVWELWNDVSTRRFRQRIEDEQGVRFLPQREPESDRKHDLERLPVSASPPTLLSDIDKIFQANHMDRRHPLSVDSFQSWRKSVVLGKEEVVEVPWPQGGKALEIRTQVSGPHKDYAIVSADFIVRNEDWHPVQQRLQIQTQNGAETYELAEQAFQVMTLSSLPVSLFSDVPMPAPPALPQVSSASPKPDGIFTSDMREAEIEARYALHRLQACLGEPIELLRDNSGRVEIRGLVATSERKEELTTALNALSNLKVSIETVDEAVSSSSTALNRVQDATRFVDSRLPIQTPLERYFKSLDASSKSTGGKLPVHLRIAQLSKDAIVGWEKAMADAWALRQLAESFSTEDAHPLRPSYSWLLESMVHDHLESLTRETDETRKLLNPVLSSIRSEQVGPSEKPTGSAAPDGSLPSDLKWQGLSRRLFDRVEAVRALIHGLFGGSGLEMKEDRAVGDLLFNLSVLEDGFHRLEAQIRREFSENSERVSRNQN